MRPLWLDYRQETPGQQRSGWVLLALGVAVAAGLAIHFFSLQAEEEALQLQVSHLRREAEKERLAAGSGTPAAAAPSPASHPLGSWDSLFTSLEGAGDDTVTLLSIQPGPNEVQITGEAHDLGAALDYLKRLQAAPGVANARLTQSEVVEAHPQHPVRFSLATNWQEAPR